MWGGGYKLYTYIDLHGCTITEAKIRLDAYLNSVSPLIKEITIVHGYHSGRALLQYIRKQYRHKKVARVIITMNHGETVYILKT